MKERSAIFLQVIFLQSLLYLMFDVSIRKLEFNVTPKKSNNSASQVHVNELKEYLDKTLNQRIEKKNIEIHYNASINGVFVYVDVANKLIVRINGPLSANSPPLSEEAIAVALNLLKMLNKMLIIASGN